MKGLVYTAIFGGKDRPQPRRVHEPDVDYVMFTDTNGAAGWNVKPALKSKDPRRAARNVKVYPPMTVDKYDWILWVDGSHIPKVPIAPHVKKWLEHRDFAAYKHHGWDCTYKEIGKCKEFRKDTAEKLDRSERILRAVGFPEHYGQLASTIVARRVDSEKVRIHTDFWRHWVRHYSIRDQVSFMYGLWVVGGGALSKDLIHWCGPTAFGNAEFHYQGGH